MQVSIQPAGDIAGEGLVTNAQDRTVQRRFAGQGADDDIVVSSTRAYVAALSRMATYLNERKGSAAAAHNGGGSAGPKRPPVAGQRQVVGQA